MIGLPTTRLPMPSRQLTVRRHVRSPRLQPAASVQLWAVADITTRVRDEMVAPRHQSRGAFSPDAVNRPTLKIFARR